jgi:hypothetical protein
MAIEQLSHAAGHLLDRLYPVMAKVKDIIVSALKLGGALTLTVFGAAMGIAAALQVRLSDAAMLAFEQRTHSPPSASSARDFFLMMIGCGVVVLIWGLHLVGEWIRPFQKRYSRAKPPAAAE